MINIIKFQILKIKKKLSELKSFLKNYKYCERIKQGY